MRIGVNTRLLLAGKMDGMGWFASETLRRMVQAHPEHQFFFFFDRPYDAMFVFADNVHPVVLQPPARHPVLWHLFFEWSIPWALRHYRIDLFLSPDGYASLRTKVPTLTVIHDINFEHYPQNLKPSHQRFMCRFSSRYAHHSTRVATVSEYSKQDLIQTYHLDADKIDVVYDGAHEGYVPLSNEKRQQVRDRYTQGCRYIIFIGTILKRKNLATLLTAFDCLKEQHQSSLKLLVVGHKVWWQDELERAYRQMHHTDDVIFMGRADADVLTQLLASAEVLAYPSLFEGFGIPIIEAFHTETPVVTSNCTSMPEVAGDAALLVNPTDADALARALFSVLSDITLRERLVERGRQRRELFSWDITTQLLWESIMKVADAMEPGE